MTSLCMGTRCYNFDSGFKFIETLSMVLRSVCVRYDIRRPSHPLYREITMLFCICRKKKNTPQIWTNACLAQHKESEHHQTASVFYRFQAQKYKNARQNFIHFMYPANASWVSQKQIKRQFTAQFLSNQGAMRDCFRPLRLLSRDLRSERYPHASSGFPQGSPSIVTFQETRTGDWKRRAAS